MVVRYLLSTLMIFIRFRSSNFLTILRAIEESQKSINQRTEELLEKKMGIMKENLSAELGIKIDQTNKKIDQINAVSYTHLDVYKRQVIIVGHLLPYFLTIILH